jgi:hypothetical protein
LEEVPLEAGTYTTRDLSSRFVRNNDISLLQINNGYEVVLFDDDNFTGDSVAFQGAFNCLMAVGWSDRASSLKIRAVGAISTAGQFQHPDTKQDMQVKLHPNPVVNTLHLSSAVSLAGSQYCILNTWGKTLASGSLTQASLDVTALPTGLYTLLVVATDGKTTAHRFLKQ